jgi:hypothetical protein
VGEEKQNTLCRGQEDVNTRKRSGIVEARRRHPIRCVDQASQIYQDQSEGYTHVDLVRRQTFSVAVFVQGLFWPHMATITNHRFNFFHIPPDRTLHSLPRLNNRLRLQSLSFVAKIAA